MRKRRSLLASAMAQVAVVAVVVAVTTSVTSAVIALAPTLPARAGNAATPDRVLPPPIETGRPARTGGSSDTATETPSARVGGVIDPTISSALRDPATSRQLQVEIVTTTPDATQQLAVIGAHGTASIGGVTLASLTATQIERLAAAPGVTSIRQPVDLHLGLLGPPAPTRGPVMGENSLYREWLDAGFDGKGVAVGIIDLFDPAWLTTQITQGELPKIPAGNRACFSYGAPCTFGSPGYTHGNAVAEIVADGAPGATFYLAEVATITDYVLAIDWFAAHGVSIINHSATGPYDGPGNGTGPAAAVVDYAVAKGITWFNSAGNANQIPEYNGYYAGGYWRGTWSDSNSNRWLNFKSSDESLSVYCGALMGLRWSDWGTSRTDYDLYISDYNISTKTNGGKVLAGARSQAAGATPIEGNDLRWLCNTNPAYGPVYDKNGDGFVSLWVYRTTRTSASPTGDVLEVMVNAGWLEYSTSAGSAAIPFGDSANPGAASIGARKATSFFVADYSARGPTNDGRVKPDFVAEGCFHSSIYGWSSNCDTAGFAGTSASAPAVAGMAAVGRSVLALPTPALVVSWLRSLAQTGPFPKSNVEGWGRPELGLPPATNQSGAVYTPVPPMRVFDTRGVNGVSLGSWIGVRGADTLTRVHLGYVTGTNVVLNVALVGASAPGFLQVLPTGHAAPGATSNVNVSVTGQTRANLVVVAVGQNGDVSFYTSGGGHIIADLVGLFTPTVQGHIGGNPYVPLEPYNAYDSHTCGGCSGAPLGNASYVDVALSGTSASFDPSIGVPEITDLEDAPTAVAIAVTISGASGPGFMSVVPPTTTEYTTSNLNYFAGDSLTATTFIPVAAYTEGKARVYVSRSAHVRVDVLGYFTIGGHGSLGYFNAVGPVRVIDTRSGARPSAGATTDIALPGHFGIPQLPIGAVFLNTTAVNSAGSGFLTSGATAASERYRTTSIPAAGVVIASATIASATPSGVLKMHTSVQSDFIGDVSGWFTGEFDEPLPSGATATVVENPPPSSAFDQLAISDDGGVIAYRTGVYKPLGQQGISYWKRATGITTIALGNLDLNDLQVSGDGSTLLFDTATALVPGDSNGVRDVYSYRLSDGAIQRESVGVGGAQLSTASTLMAVSDNTSLVAFLSSSAIVGGDLDSLDDVYVRNRTSGALTLASGGAEADFSVYTATMNGPGTVVAMVAAYENTNGGTDRRMITYSLGSAATTSGSYPINGPQEDRFTDMSDNGSIVLVNDSGRSLLIDLATNAVTNVGNPPVYDPSYVTPHGSIDGAAQIETQVRRYVPFAGMAGLPDPDQALVFTINPRTVRKVSISANGAMPSSSVVDAVVSDNGRFVVYLTFATNMTPTSTSGPCIYVVDLSKI